MLKKWKEEELFTRYWLIHPQVILGYSVYLVVVFNILVSLKDDWMLPMTTLQIPLAAAYLHLSYMVYFHHLEVHPRDAAILLILKMVTDASGLANHVNRYEDDAHHAELAFLLSFIVFDFYAAYCLAKLTRVVLQTKTKQITRQVHGGLDLSMIPSTVVKKQKEEEEPAVAKKKMGKVEKGRGGDVFLQQHQAKVPAELSQKNNNKKRQELILDVAETQRLLSSR